MLYIKVIRQKEDSYSPCLAQQQTVRLLKHCQNDCILWALAHRTESLNSSGWSQSLSYCLICSGVHIQIYYHNTGLIAGRVIMRQNGEQVTGLQAITRQNNLPVLVMNCACSVRGEHRSPALVVCSHLKPKLTALEWVAVREQKVANIQS